jgi:hypothetical protein
LDHAPAILLALILLDIKRHLFSVLKGPVFPLAQVRLRAQIRHCRYYGSDEAIEYDWTLGRP